MVLAGTLGVVLGAGSFAARGRQQDANPAVPLITGKVITPFGTRAEVGSFPANLAISPDGKWIVATNTGFRQYLSVLSAQDGHLVSQIAFNARRGEKDARKPALYYGLAFAPATPPGTENIAAATAPPESAQTLYVSRGPEDKVAIYRLSADGKLTETDRALDNPTGLPEAAGPNFIAGLALNADGSRCYAANNETTPFTQQKGSISILDTAANKVLGHIVTPGYPYALVALTKGANADKKVYVASERDSMVSVLDVQDPANGKNLHDIATGDQPMALLLDRTQQRLFVANAGSDTVSVIDTATDKVTRTIPVRAAEARGLPGATPTGLALSPDETRLYVSLGDLNAVAVVDLAQNALVGYVPTGWYPTSVAVSADGARLFVGEAKGVVSRIPNKAKQGPNGEWGQYVPNIIEGTVAMLPVPGAADSPEFQRQTAQVVANNRLRPDLASANRDALPKTGVKHVIYIIKENRTYDQVLGDLASGDGDPALVLFGRNVTPNQHALAERFVLLDNFYDCAETSGDGWDWSTSGMASEYTIRNLPFNYSGRGRNYDFEGQNNGVPVDMLGIRDVARAPGGYIWDNCARHGVSYRNYGFYNAFSDGEKGPDGKPIVKDNAPTKKALSGAHNDENFFRFDMAYADSDAWKTLNAPAPLQRRAYGKFNASSRYAEWRREFDQYVKNGDLPQFSMLRLPRDHTQGTSPGLHSPRAMVADNDYAVGQIVEAVSHSRYWNETAIFVLEDDAQSGQDHVDAHRSICFVISPYIKKATVDHRFYNTDSVLRTMEALLNLPPMCQYDAVAPLIGVFDTQAVNAAPYAALLPPREIIGEVNSKTAYRAKDSQRLDFSREDRVPDAVLNDILWHSVKGVATPEPPARHGLRLTAFQRRPAASHSKRGEEDD